MSALVPRERNHPEPPVSDPRSIRDAALDQLSSEFPTVSVRIVLSLFLTYLDRLGSVSSAVAATRARINDACSL